MWDRRGRARGRGCRGCSGYVLDVSWTVRFRELNILAILAMVPAKPAIEGDMCTQALDMVAVGATRSHSPLHAVGLARISIATMLFQVPLPQKLIRGQHAR